MSANNNIWVAAADGKLAVVKSLIESGNFTPESKDPNGYTPIHAATSYGYIDLLKYLCIEQKGNINVQDSDGDTPLHHVEDIDVAKFLVNELKADYKIKNSSGLTPLMYHEEEEEFPELIQYFSLLENGDGGEQKAVDEEDGIEAVLPNGEKIRYVLGDEQEETEEQQLRKQKLQEIMTNGGEDQEENLREFVMDSMRQHMNKLGGDDDEKYKERDSSSSKRRK